MSESVDLGIVDIVGSGLCIASDDGDKVHSAIVRALREGRSVALSFKGVTDLTSAFLNAAIGQLYGEFREDEIRGLLSVTDTTQDDLHVLSRVVERAKQFFRDPEPFHRAAEKALGLDDA